MNISIFFDSRHLGHWEWSDFTAGNLPLSGTDGQNLALAQELAKLGNKIHFLSTQPTTFVSDLVHLKTEDLVEAVHVSAELKSDVLIFNNRANLETQAGIRECARFGQRCVLWDQNGPAITMANVMLEGCVKRLICVSASHADNVRDHPVFSKTEFIYNSLSPTSLVTPEQLTIPRNPRAVCFLGSLTPSKGFHHLARVWPRVRRAFPDAELTVIGNARLYERHQRLGQLGVADEGYEIHGIIPYLGKTQAEAARVGVKFFGLASPREIKAILLRSSVGVVNPNYRDSTETFCVSAAEIQAAGVAVVGGNAGGLRETVVQGRTGMLVRSEPELEKALIRLLDDPLKAIAMGKEGAAWARTAFDRSHIALQWQNALSAAANNIAVRPPGLAWERLTPRLLAREFVRLSRRTPLIGHNIPTLHEFKSRFSLKRVAAQ